MKKLSILVILMIVSSIFLMSKEYPAYGHISYLDKEATVLRLDGRVDKAVINLPLVPGDKISTNDSNRCEIQFDNGTIIRLGRNTTLKITTVVANSLTTDWKITTLELLKGKVYCMTQVYNSEMIQLITPTASIRFDKNIVAQISLDKDNNTLTSVFRGKPGVLFGPSIKKFKQESLKKGKSYIITGNHNINETAPVNKDFRLWNEDINRNFKALHHGKSKVPKKISRYSKGIINWAEKWSTRYGEWIYNDLFGYVWKPYNETFAYSKRPFLHASYTEINGELFLVPSQPWGWAPAHLGTWVFMKNHGWTWVPGDAFSGGIVGSAYYMAEFSGNDIFGPLFQHDQSPYYFSNFTYWMQRCYGGYDLYMIYRNKGRSYWADCYYKKYGVYLERPYLARIPSNIKQIFKKLDGSYTRYIHKTLGKSAITKHSSIRKIAPADNSRGSFFKDRSIKALEPLKVSGSQLRQSNPELFKVRNKKTLPFGKGLSTKAPKATKIDWNPDKLWSARKKHPVFYSSRKNAVVCPSLNLSSRTITEFQKRRLTRGRSEHQSSPFINSNSGSGFSSGGPGNGANSVGSSGSTGSFSKKK